MPAEKRHDDEIPMDAKRVRALLRAQFRQWGDLPLQEWDEQGTDHTLFRLGDHMVVRMPIRPFNNAPLEDQQVGREARNIPLLAPYVPLHLPEQYGLGVPTDDYPWHWSVVEWIEGGRATCDSVDLCAAAVDVAEFVKALHTVDATDGSPAGAATWGRGLSMRRGEKLIRKALDDAAEFYDVAPMRAALEDALAADEWDRPPVWFHGDLDGNLIARDGRVVAVIDSGYAVGDPACDLMVGWTLFTGESRRLFFETVAMDDATVIRARGWVLAPAAYGLVYYRNVPLLFQGTINSIEAALAD